MKVMDAAAMRQADARTIQEIGLSGLALMEAAGRGVFEEVRRHLGGRQRVVVLCGKGNNGGDGFVVARWLREAGVSVRTLALFPLPQARGDAAAHLQIAQRCGVLVEEVHSEQEWGHLNALASADLVVDALLGTGLTAPVEGLLARVITDVNAAGIPIVAVDIPSGVDASTGQILGVAVRATSTVTFAAAKPGLLLGPGAAHAGALTVVDIGIPAVVVGPLTCGEVLTRRRARGLLPGRPREGHKGSFGHVLVVAGGQGKLGAAALCCAAALRSGAGLVTLALPRTAVPALVPFPPEVMIELLPDDGGGRLGVAGLDPLRELARGKQALAVGPGLGLGEEQAAVVEGLIQFGLPTVLDADALTSLARREGAPPLGPRVVITPHPGEAGRLLGWAPAQIQADRLAAARALSRRWGCAALLKGAGTIITRPEGTFAINPTGNPGMGTAGSGDVLTGIVGGLLAQGLAPFDAGCLGAYVHGMAGDLAAQDIGQRALIASDLVAALGQAFSTLEAAP